MRERNEVARFASRARQDRGVVRAGCSTRKFSLSDRRNATERSMKGFRTKPTARSTKRSVETRRFAGGRQTGNYLATLLCIVIYTSELPITNTVVRQYGNCRPIYSQREKLGAPTKTVSSIGDFRQSKIENAATARNSSGRTIGAPKLARVR